MLGKRGNVMFILLLLINGSLYIANSLQFPSGLPGGPLNFNERYLVAIRANEINRDAGLDVEGSPDIVFCSSLSRSEFCDSAGAAEM
jgi:hypothetical protein